MIDHEDSAFEYDDDEHHEKSKSQLKREMAALQELGVSIAKLSLEQRGKIPLDTGLRKAIDDAEKIKTNSAKRRHMQYIGKLMRKSDSDAIRAAYDEVIASAHRSARQLHVIEDWRDSLISGDKSTLEQFITEFPSIDRQQLNQLVRSAKRDSQANKPEGARKLFRFIRDNLAQP